MITEASPEIDWEDHLQGRFQIQLPAPRARRPSIALLKSAYLVAFAKYGYLYIAQPPDLDLVRSQIAAPDSSILDPVPPIFVTPEQHPTNRRLLMIDEPELMLCVHIGRDIVFLPWVDTPQGVYERLASWNQEHQPSEMSFSLSGPWPSEPLYWWDHEMPD